jgi:hypothetical protein
MDSSGAAMIAAAGRVDDGGSSGARTRGNTRESFRIARATEALFQETWAQTRTLHEDLIERLKHLGE